MGSTGEASKNKGKARRTNPDRSVERRGKKAKPDFYPEISVLKWRVSKIIDDVVELRGIPKAVLNDTRKLHALMKHFGVDHKLGYTVGTDYHGGGYVSQTTKDEGNARVEAQGGERAKADDTTSAADA